jgi:FtsP/CotA-like multicopper oxidase with cupredoxin domain
MTPSGIELATFWFVAQYLNHCNCTVKIMYWSILSSHIHPEDGNWNVRRSVVTASRNEVLRLENPTYLRHNLHLSGNNFRFLMAECITGWREERNGLWVSRRVAEKTWARKPVERLIKCEKMASNYRNKLRVSVVFLRLSHYGNIIW